jgi:hypothetical protein
MNTSTSHRSARHSSTLPPEGAMVLFSFSSGGTARRMKGKVIHRSSRAVDVQIPGGRVSVPASDVLGGWPPKK